MNRAMLLLLLSLAAIVYGTGRSAAAITPASVSATALATARFDLALAAQMAIAGHENGILSYPVSAHIVRPHDSKRLEAGI